MTTLQTHASIDTPDLAASVAFYRALLAAEPALRRPDYARFDLADPPVVLGLNAVAAATHARIPRASATGVLEHLGLRLPDDDALDAARARLAHAGAPTEHEADTVCCYARLARVWTEDPSGVRWELFVVREAVTDAPHRAADAPDRAADASSCCAPACCAELPA